MIVIDKKDAVWLAKGGCDVPEELHLIWRRHSGFDEFIPHRDAGEIQFLVSSCAPGCRSRIPSLAGIRHCPQLDWGPGMALQDGD